jgi:hypothetical protein
MSDDINENITITGESSGAITALDNAVTSVGRFDDKLHTLGDTFSKPLEHAGVDIFGKQLLRSMGLAGEARPIMGLLNTAVKETAAVFGFAAGAAGLAVFGFTALAAIIYKLIEGHNKQAEALKKVNEENQKQFVTTFDLLAGLEEYKNKVKDTIPVIDALIKSKREENEQDKLKTLKGMGDELTKLDNQKRATKELIDTNKSLSATAVDLIHTGEEGAYIYKTAAQQQAEYARANDVLTAALIIN